MYIICMQESGFYLLIKSFNVEDVDMRDNNFFLKWFVENIYLQYLLQEIWT